MKITLNIILDVLSGYQFENYIDDDERCFNECLLLPEYLQELKESCIYVGRLTEVLALPLPENICCICVRDRFKDGRETEETLKDLVIVN